MAVAAAAAVVAAAVLLRRYMSNDVALRAAEIVLRLRKILYVRIIILVSTYSERIARWCRPNTGRPRQ